MRLGYRLYRAVAAEDVTFQQLVRDGVPFVVDDCTEGFDSEAISRFECRAAAIP